MAYQSKKPLVTNYTVSPTAGTVTFDLVDFYGKQQALPGNYTLDGTTVTYQLQDVPPELGIV